MYFPKFWAKAEWRGADRDGKMVAQDAWGWSDVSQADAQAKAVQRARVLVESWSGDRGDREHYSYPNRPLREPVLHSLSRNPEVAAVVTRNRIGCEVLNADRVVFLDVDLPAPRRPGLLARLFGGPQTQNPVNDSEAINIAQLEYWTSAHREATFRVYRTAAGLRYLLTSVLATPEDDLTQQAFAELDVDPQYQLLCRQQKSFRARLTPKPHRIRVRRPPFAFPAQDASAEAQLASWVARYDAARRAFAVCRFVRTIGTAPQHPAVASIVADHDRLTGAASALPLA